MKDKIPMLRRKPAPQGRSLKVNFKISEPAFKFLQKIKDERGYTKNSEVFDLIYSTLESSEISLSEIDMERARNWRTFTLNEYTLSRLKKLAKERGISSVDDLIETALTIFQDWRSEKRRNWEPEVKKFADKDFCMEAIEEIWEQVSKLRYGLDYVFGLDYENSDPENYNCWFANIEGGLQELENLIPRLFETEAT